MYLSRIKVGSMGKMVKNFQLQKQLSNYKYLSVFLSISKTPQPLRIKPICYYAYLISDISDL